MARSRSTGLCLAALAFQGLVLMASAQYTTPQAGAMYIIEAANATFVNANTLVMDGASGSTAFKVNYPYSDAGVMDTEVLLQDPTYSPQGLWLGSPMGTIFGTASNGNATAVILLINALPVFDPLAGTLTFNVTIVSDPKYIKFPDGIARLTYAKAVTPNAFARPLVVTAQVSNGAIMTSVALFLDVDQTTINPASAPAPPTGITNNNYNNGGGYTNNNNNNGGGYVNNNNNGGGITYTNNNGGAGGYTNNNNNGGGAITNNNGVSSGVPTTQAAPNTITNNNNNGGSSVVPPAAPGQTPAPGTYNVITTTTDCNGHVDVQYSYVPGLRGISRNNNNNCG